MANNKDFIVKNAVEVGGSTKVTVGDAAAGGSYTQGYDLSVAAYDSVSFSVSGQDTVPQGIFVSTDGTKMYIVGTTSDTVYQYSLSTANDLSTASYDSVSFSVSAQETVPADLFFKPDGTKMYVSGGSGDDVNEYTLSTAWDISTATFVTNFSISSQAGNIKGVHFKSNGTKMYALSGSTDFIYQYSLSTAWDISTASYDSISFSVTSQASQPQSLRFNDDGLKMYVTGDTSDTVFEYNLSTAWDISSAAYSSVSLSVSSQESAPQGICFSYDGTKMYMVGSGTDTIYQYSTGSTVTTGSFDLSTGNYFTDTPSADVEYTFSNAGDVQSFQVEVTGAQSVVGYDLSEAAYDSVTISTKTLVSPTSLSAGGLFFKPDGTKMFVCNYGDHYIEEFDLSAAFDISSATYSSNRFSVLSQDDDPRNLWFKPDGTKMYVIGLVGDKVYEYDLSTAWDVTSASFNDYISIVSKHTNPKGLAFNNDGTKMYTLGASTNYMNEWTLSTAWDVTTATYSQQFNTGSQAAADNGLAWNSDGTKVFIAESSGDTILQYSLTTAFDISTMSYDMSLSVASQDTFPSDVKFNADGTKMFMIGANGGVYQYSTSVTTPITITWDADIEWGGGTAPDSPAAGEKDLYTITTDDGGTTYFGVQSGDAFS